MGAAAKRPKVTVVANVEVGEVAIVPQYREMVSKAFAPALAARAALSAAHW